MDSCKILQLDIPWNLLAEITAGPEGNKRKKWVGRGNSGARCAVLLYWEKAALPVPFGAGTVSTGGSAGMF